MPDLGERYTDQKLARVNSELRKTYRTAQRELKQKLADFEKRFAKKNKKKKAQLAEGEISQQDYKDWLTGQVFVRNQWQANLRQICEVMHDANQQAINIINTSRFDVFAENYNFNAWQAEKAINVSFNLYNAEAVARLILEDPQLLPAWKIDKEKDYVWNQKRVNNIIRQGIIQGEGIPDITTRLCSELSTSNKAKMQMFARTAMGAAQSAGRQKQMEDAAAMGIDVHKRWIAAHDSRTRDAHRDLDGKEVPYNESFDSELGPIRYPKDPEATPANVFNCRCTMVTIYPKYEDRSRTWGEGEIIDGQSYEEWKKGKQKQSTFADGPKDTAKDRQEGMELLRRFVEGESVDIHRLAGVNAIIGFRYDESKVDEESMRKLDSVFEPAEHEMHLYKGMPMTYDDIMSLEGKHLNHTVSSTTTDEHTADDYAEKASDQETLFPVKLNITVEEGTPIADVQELLGTEGMKAFEKEITIGRNVVWEYGEPTVKTDKYGDEYYEVSVKVYKEDDERRK